MSFLAVFYLQECVVVLEPECIFKELKNKTDYSHGVGLMVGFWGGILTTQLTRTLVVKLHVNMNTTSL